LLDVARLRDVEAHRPDEHLVSGNTLYSHNEPKLTSTARRAKSVPKLITCVKFMDRIKVAHDNAAALNPIAMIQEWIQLD
jgi:hypothetical protein